MIRKYLLSEELGRNIIWVMLSGFFKNWCKRKFVWSNNYAKRSLLFGLDDKNIDENYPKFNQLHYIFLDGSTEFLYDERFKNKKTNIYYVGQLNEFWKNVDNSQPLFNDDLKTLIENIETSKKFSFLKSTF